MIPFESIAKICHEANRRFCAEIGDDSQMAWELSPWWQKQSAIAGVAFVMQNPDAPPSAAHGNWMTRKVEEGWKYGPIKNDETKEHPAILPYDKLPQEQKQKDILFRNIVLSFLNTGVNHG